MPNQAGSYALILELPAERLLQVGRLGRMSFAPGCYLYTGSAFGPGGLAARCRHHLAISARPHWHIDYLRTLAHPLEIWYTTDPERREHQWAAVAAAGKRAQVPVSGFGSSDCACPAHLIWYPKLPSFNGFQRRLLRVQPGHGRVMRIVVDLSLSAGIRFDFLGKTRDKEAI